MSAVVAGNAFTTRGLCGVFCRKLACREGALGVPLAAEEDAATTAAPAHELALAAVRAHDAHPLDLLLHVLAVRIAGAADERAEAAAPLRERLAAVRAHLAFDDLELWLGLT